MGRGGKKIVIKTQEKRTVFNLEKDISLLKSALQHNPWQTDENTWKNVLKQLKDTFMDFPPTLSIRTIQGRVNLLIMQFQAQQLVVKTGTEEQCTERGNLLEEIIAITKFAEDAINPELGSEEESFSPGLGVENEGSSQGLIFSEEEVSAATVDTGKPRKKANNEKMNADKERDSLVTAMQTGLPPSPPAPPKRAKMTFEDELIKTKQAHDMTAENQRLALAKEKQGYDFLLDSQRLDIERDKATIEKTRLELEMKREERLAEECKRRDELARAQVDSQNKMYELMLKFTEKKA